MDALALLRNINWLTAEKIIRLFTGLLISVLVARYLGPDNLGIWNYLLALSSVFAMFAIIGLDVNASKTFVENPTKSGTITTTLFYIRLITGFMAFLAFTVLFYLSNLSAEIPLYFALIIGSGLIFQAADAVDYFYQSQLKSRYSVLARFIAFSSVSLLKIYLVYTEASLAAFLVTSTLEILLAACVFLWYLKNATLKPVAPFTFSKPMAKKIVQEGLLFMAASFFMMLSLRADQFFIVEILGPLENGIYSVAVKLFEVANFLPHVISVSFIPFLASKKFEQSENYTSSIKKMLLILSSISLFFMLGNWILAEPVMLYLYGNEYLGSGAVLKILGLCFLPLFTLVILNSYLIVENLKHWYAGIALTCLLVNLTLNSFLIPKFGISGAAFAYCASLYGALLMAGMVVFFHSKKTQN
ncbi:MAG: flippase [Luteibaculaceae bacterium]